MIHSRSAYPPSKQPLVSQVSARAGAAAPVDEPPLDRFPRATECGVITRGTVDKRPREVRIAAQMQYMAKVAAAKEKSDIEVTLVMAGLAAGRISPFDAQAIQISGMKADWQSHAYLDTRKVFAGAFAPVIVEPGGAIDQKGETTLTDRRSVMANAYHWAKALSASAASFIDVSDHATPGMLNADGRLHGINADGRADMALATGDTASAIRGLQEVEMAGATLAAQFGFDAPGYRAALVAGRAPGFRLGHSVHDKLLEVSATGEITLYDAAGKGWSAPDYNAANVGGSIPELYNDMLPPDPEGAFRGEPVRPRYLPF